MNNWDLAQTVLIIELNQLFIVCSAKLCEIDTNKISRFQEKEYMNQVYSAIKKVLCKSFDESEKRSFFST